MARAEHRTAAAQRTACRLGDSACKEGGLAPFALAVVRLVNPFNCRQWRPQRFLCQQLPARGCGPRDRHRWGPLDLAAGCLMHRLEKQDPLARNMWEPLLLARVCALPPCGRRDQQPSTIQASR